jgi:hypothetical protein
LPKREPVEYEFNSIGFYGGLLSRLDETIKNTEELYKQSFYKVSSYRPHDDAINHVVHSNFKQFDDKDLAGGNQQEYF